MSQFGSFSSDLFWYLRVWKKVMCNESNRNRSFKLQNMHLYSKQSTIFSYQAIKLCWVEKFAFWKILKFQFVPWSFKKRWKEFLFLSPMKQKNLVIHFFFKWKQIYRRIHSPQLFLSDFPLPSILRQWKWILLFGHKNVLSIKHLTFVYTKNQKMIFELEEKNPEIFEIVMIVKVVQSDRVSTQ